MRPIQSNENNEGGIVRRLRNAAVAAVAVGAIALSGVAGTGTAGAQSSVRGVTSTEIKVGGLGPLANFAAAGPAAKARFDVANKNGEIPGGRKINYIGWSDDKSLPDTNLTETRTLVDQQQVFAVVPAITPAFQGGTYLNQQKVPAVGWGVSAPFCDPTNKYIFGFTGCLVPNPPVYPGNTWGELVDAQFKAQGVKTGAKGKTAAVISENNDGGKTGNEVIVATAEAVGMKIVYAEASVPAAPAVISDYTPFVQALMASNGGQPPDVIFIVTSSGPVFGLSRALTQAGFKGVSTNAVLYAPQVISLGTGWSVFTGFATPESPAPEMKTVVATLNAGGIATADIGQPALAGYFAADQFIAILKKVGKNLTPERFSKVASNFTYEVKDVIGPTVYPASFKAGAPCGQMVTSNGTAFVVTSPYACFDLLTKKGTKWVQVPYPQGVK